MLWVQIPRIVGVSTMMIDHKNSKSCTACKNTHSETVPLVKHTNRMDLNVVRNKGSYHSVQALRVKGAASIIRTLALVYVITDL